MHRDDFITSSSESPAGKRPAFSILSELNVVNYRASVLKVERIHEFMAFLYLFCGKYLSILSVIEMFWLSRPLERALL